MCTPYYILIRCIESGELCVFFIDSSVPSITTACLLYKCIISFAGVKNVFQTKDMEFVNVSLPWMPDHYAMVPQLVEKKLKTEQVCFYFV